MSSSKDRPCGADLVEKQVDSDIILHDPVTGCVHLLNLVAARVWELCDGCLEIEEICARVAEEFSVERSRIEADIRGIVRTLREKRLVT